jgi:tetratricopeptide (TPR) repeat protein
VAISQGSSGGGLFNAEGELVGITTFYLKDAQSLNFALPVEWIAEVAGRKIRERPRGEAPGVPEPRTRPQTGWAKRADALVEAKDWQGLLAHCRRETQAEPGDYSAWFYIGIAYGQMGRHREAIEANQEALHLKPDYAMAWGNLAAAYANSGNRSAALEALREFRRYDPQKADELFNWIMKR